jgi:hypothetical protein
MIAFLDQYCIDDRSQRQNRFGKSKLMDSHGKVDEAGNLPFYC